MSPEQALANGNTSFFDVMPDSEHLVVSQKQGAQGARLVVIENARSVIEAASN
jgi:hypothetical protein